MSDEASSEEGVIEVPGISLFPHLTLHINTHFPWRARGIWTALLDRAEGTKGRKGSERGRKSILSRLCTTQPHAGLHLMTLRS